MVVINLLPFFIHEVNAETITSHVVGTNVWTDRIDYIAVDSSANQYRNYCNVHVEIVFDNEYVGWQNLGLAVYYYSVNFSNNTWTRYNRQVSGNYYINGSSLEIVVPIQFDSIAQPYYQAYNGTGQTLPQSDSSINLSFTTQGNITALSELQTLQDIFSVLNDIYDNVSIDIYGELQNIVTELGLSNQYLQTISKLRQFDLFPESFSWCSYLFNNAFIVSENTKIYYYNYPIYSIDANKQIYWTTNLGTNNSQKLWLFFSTNVYLTSSNIGNYFDLSPFNLEHLSLIEYYKPIFIYRLCLTGNYQVNQNQNYVLKTLQTIPNFTPLTAGIYRSNDINQIFPFNSDLALYLGVNNKELNYLNIIANGTTQSNNSASQLENQNDDLQDSQSQLFQYEDDFNDDMNTALQSINTNFDIGTSFNSKFLLAADWVRVQFNLLTNQNPFGTLLSFSLLLGVALLIMGKVLG